MVGDNFAGSVIVDWSIFHGVFDSAEIRRYAPMDPGVYLLWQQVKRDKWVLFYVGETRDLEQTLINHLSGDETNSCVREKVQHHECGFEYAVISSKEIRKGIVKFLYDHYKPKCVPKDPGGRPIEVNLP